ncbi:hypothetical protein HDU77_005673 [Chytriomyces hyalinus]|nr:hypothetical protein HDU77_005673 [Chytriomyces hyalinus]
MSQVYALGVTESQTQLQLISIPRREVGPSDVHIQVDYCGICHSDMHFCRQEWGQTQKPSVPGHEIVGKVTQIGSQVSKFKVGDSVGVGCFVDACRECKQCKDSADQFCEKGPVQTYGSPLTDGTGHTMGGYSQAMVVDEAFVLSVPTNLDPAAVAPLLCAGITVYSPLKHYGVKAGSKIAVLGLGGLGHMAVKFASKMGARVTVLSRSEGKKEQALALGAESVLITSDADAFKAAHSTFEFVLDTIGDEHDVSAYMNLLGVDGTYIMVGASPKPFSLSAFGLIVKRIKIGGSLVGSIKETQEMLDFCAEHGIVSDVEVVKAEYVEKAWERVLKSDVKFRFVIDVAGSLNADTVVLV